MIRKAKTRSTVFILLSLAVHLCMVLVLLDRVHAPPVAPARIEVEYSDATIPPAAIASKTAPKTARAQTRSQIVEQQKRLNDEVDDQSRFLSAFDQKVQRETRAANAGKFTNVTTGQKQMGGDRRGDKKSAATDKTKTAAAREAGELPSLKQLIPKFALNDGPIGTAAEQSGEAAQTDDYLKDVHVGMQTLLSTREFVYYTYYNRIKESLRQHWEPDVRERVKIIYRQGRTIASSKDRLTQVMVTLDARGELIKVDLLTQSGVLDLDGAAVQAFKEAAPFPNPPKGMIEGDGTVRIRWDFVLEV